MPALSAFVTNITQDRFIPRVQDNVMSGNVIALRLMKQARPWNGGTPIRVPVALSDITAVGSYSGFDTLSTVQEDTRQLASFNPSQLYVSVPISGIQRAANSGDAAVLDLVATELEWRTNRLRDEFGTEIYGDGTGNSSKDILGLIAHVDDTTAGITTYGGISRSAFTNWRATYTSQSGAIALANLAADFNAAQIGNESPTIMVTTPAVFNLVEALFNTKATYNTNQQDIALDENGIPRSYGAGVPSIGGGYRALFFRGIPLVQDDKCTAANLYTLNEKHLFFYILPQPVGFTVESERDGFGWTGWLQGVNQDAVVGRLQWYGQLIGDGPRYHARRVAITT